MKVYRDIDRVEAKNAVVTVGTYDGVHQGHQKVIRQLQEAAKALNGETLILTFWPHPRMVIRPEDKELMLLNTLEEKIELLEKAGLDHLVIYPFTKSFSRMSSEQFVKEILIEKIGTRHLVVGHDHRFGSKRQGGFSLLRNLSRTYDFTVEQVGVLNYDHFSISSSQIREALRLGDLDLARQFLGYNYYTYGIVSQGKKLGRSIGFPTANLKTETFKMLPANGVYAVRAEIDQTKYAGMANIGMRPTIHENDGERTFEIHLFDFNREIYGKTLMVEFLKKIRDEKKFADVTELKYQLERDKSQIYAYHKKQSAGIVRG